MNKINGDPNYEVGGTSRSLFLWKNPVKSELYLIKIINPVIEWGPH